MRIAIIHGYFLSDSGSAVYVRELARELVLQGHEITLVCQEQAPEDYDFIDSAYALDPAGETPRLIHERKGGRQRPHSGAPGAVGSCRLVRPGIGRRLLTYVAGPFPGFDAIPFQDALDSDIEAYLQANIMVLERVFSLWPPELVIANHLVAQPYVARRALEHTFLETGGRPPYVVAVHGSALNFTVKKDRRMEAYAREGIEGARAVISLSRSSREQVVSFAADLGMDGDDRFQVVPPGVDTRLFTPEAGTPSPEADHGGAGETLLFVGRLLWTKGLQYSVAALPLVLMRLPQVRLVVAGDGPMGEPLEEFIGRLDAGDLEGAAAVVASAPGLRAVDEYGPVLPEMDRDRGNGYIEAAREKIADRIVFLGHRPHEELAPLYASASIVLTPSVFPEAFALVSAEAMAGGAIPLATYQTGLKDPIDAARDLLSEPILTSLKPGCQLTDRIAAAVVHILGEYPTTDRGFRQQLHMLAESRYSWEAVASRYLEMGRGAG